jgi:hypothetical protein
MCRSDILCAIRDAQKETKWLRATRLAFWQGRFYDFNVYSQRKRLEKLNSMHANPVKRGLVEHPKDWRHNSCRFYRGTELGSVSMDRRSEKEKSTQDPGTQNRSP